MKTTVTDLEIINACKNSLTMSEASSKLNMHFNTFVRHAKRLNVYNPNQGSKGLNKPKIEGNGKIPLTDILNGKHPQYQTFKLKLRLYESNLKNNCCEECGLSTWNNKDIECELDHINGNSCDHRLENLKILCPNCHSQTLTFRSKNRILKTIAR